jgi:hypothetical protein
MRALPWAVMLQGAGLAAQRWRALSEDDRARLTRLLHDSRGRLDKLSTRERVELRKLAGRLDLGAVANEVSALLHGGPGRRKRSR